MLSGCKQKQPCHDVHRDGRQAERARHAAASLACLTAAQLCAPCPEAQRSDALQRGLVVVQAGRFVARRVRVLDLLHRNKEQTGKKADNKLSW